jgi:putative transcriptional regulator
MDLYAMTDKAVLKELGYRLRTLRLRRDITQKALAERAGVSVSAVKSLEAGNARLATLVAVLRGLGELEALGAFIPPVTVSPVEMSRSKSERQRASSVADKAAVSLGLSGKVGHVIINENGETVPLEDLHEGESEW